MCISKLSSRLSYAARSPVGMALLLWACLLSGCCTSRVEPRFFTWERALGDQLPEVQETQGSFRVSIQRSFDGAREAELLAIVEATYPLYPDSILLQDFNRPGEDDEPRWWGPDVDGILIPVSITESTVRYYLALIRSWRQEAVEQENFKYRSASFEYSAEISPATEVLEFEEGVSDLADKFVVQMGLAWRSNCGSRCGLVFKRRRTAIIDADGQVLEILEDPLAPVTIE